MRGADGAFLGISGKPDYVRASCEGSLKRLGVETIDLYYQHRVDPQTPIEETVGAMAELVREGKVTYVGSSNFAGWDIATAQSAAARRNFLGLASEQSLYNLAARTVELEVLPACRSYGVGVIPWSPLAGGALAGGLSGATGGRRAPASPG